MDVRNPGSASSSATPLTGFINQVTGNAANFSPTANTISCLLFALSYSLTFSKIAIQVTSADGTNHYDLGFYTLAGSLVANLGGVHFPSTGAIATNTAQGAQPIASAMYWFCYTGDSNSAKFEGATSCLSLAFANSATASALGVLPNSMTPPATTISSSNLSFGLL